MIKKHVKMKVVSEEQYLKLQDLLFDNGIYWGSIGLTTTPTHLWKLQIT